MEAKETSFIRTYEPVRRRKGNILPSVEGGSVRSRGDPSGMFRPAPAVRLWAFLPVMNYPICSIDL